MFAARNLPGWLNLLLYWTLVTALGGMVVYLTGVLASDATLDSVFDGAVTALVFAGAPLGGAAGGLAVGVGQWLALRRERPAAWTWILASAIGWAAGLWVTALLLLWLLPEGIGYFTLIAPLALGGAVAGGGQLLILNRWLPEAGWWWVAASAMGWVVGWIAALALVAGSAGSTNLMPGGRLALLGGLHGAIIGFESGLALVALARLSQFAPLIAPREAGPDPDVGEVP